MNRLHHWLCQSANWRKTLEQRVPWVVAGANLGANVLELGPGPGLTTELLCVSLPHLTALERDPRMVKVLGTRLSGRNVQVVTGDATAMPFGDGRFSGSVSFTMLHHVPSPDLQNMVLREVWRVLKPGGIFVGSDSLPSLFMRLIHIGDTLVPIDPETFGARLEGAGFNEVEIEKSSRAFRFRARRPPNS